MKRREPNSRVRARRATHFSLDRQFQPTFFIRQFRLDVGFLHPEESPFQNDEYRAKRGLSPRGIHRVEDEMARPYRSVLA